MQKAAQGEAQSESLSGGESSSGTASNAESVVLGPGSSFGSTSSSASSSNLSSLKAQADDGHGIGGACLQDIKVAFPSSDSFARYTYVFRRLCWGLLCFLCLFKLSDVCLVRK
jgi:hypothetical protein